MNNYFETKPLNNTVITNISHEIRNPLFNIKSFLETLYEYHFQLTDQQILEFLEIANQETNRLVRLTNYTLEFSKFDYTFIRTFNIFCFQKIVYQVIKSYELTAITKQIIICTKAKRNIIKSIANYDLMFQVISNLLNNAIKFTYPYGVIVLKIKKVSSLSLSTRKRKQCFRIDIIDSGIGISKINRKTLFKRFKRIKNDNSIINGTGLGLSLVKEILTLHNTFVVIISTINAGSTIFFNI